MGVSPRRLVRLALSTACVLLGVSSCAAIHLDNPFLPTSHLLVTADPAVVDCPITYDSTTGKYGYQDQSVTFSIKTFPNDVTPGVVFTDYEVSYYDNHGAAISNYLLPKQRLGATLYLPRGGGGTTTTTTSNSTIRLPVVTDLVIHYAEDNGFRNQGTVDAPVIRLNADPWSQNITGEATFYGLDENEHAVLASSSFTVNFLTSIPQ